MTKKKLRLIQLAMLFLALAFCAWGIRMERLRTEMPAEAGREIEVLVLPGQNAAAVAREFERAGVVVKSKDLAVWMARLGIDRRIKPGVYRITAGRAKDVAYAIMEAAPEVQSVKILPGALFGDVVRGLNRKNGDILLSEALENDENYPQEMRDILFPGAEERIVLLSPDTYAIMPGEGGADSLVKVAARTWWERHRELIPEGLTGEELKADGVLASIVQKEALKDEERAKIAGVFRNRIKEDMPLQSCATVVHAWRLQGVQLKSVSYDDVKIKSPFNTYIHKGLPPENIGIPGPASWNAVLKPAATDMLFFVARGDGSHVFSRTYKEHLNAQRKIKRGEL